MSRPDAPDARLIDELRVLISEAAPDPERAAPVLTCPIDQPLDEVIPFSSVIVLGAIVAIEEHYRLRIETRKLKAALFRGVTLRDLAAVVRQMREGSS